MYLAKIQPDLLPSGNLESQIFGRIAESSEASRAFYVKIGGFHGDSPAATQLEGKKHCASFVVSLGTCSPPPRQQLINRSAFSPETRETHRAASLSL